MRDGLVTLVGVVRTIKMVTYIYVGQYNQYHNWVSVDVILALFKQLALELYLKWISRSSH